MSVRRAAGALLMTLGGLGVAAMAALAAIVAANFVEWENAAEALSTVALIVAPPVLLSAIGVLVGRWVYGRWREETPLRTWTPRVLGVLGGAIAIVLVVILALNLASGIGPHNRSIVIVTGLMVVVCVALAIAGWRSLRGQVR